MSHLSRLNLVSLTALVIIALCFCCKLNAQNNLSESNGTHSNSIASHVSHENKESPVRELLNINSEWRKKLGPRRVGTRRSKSLFVEFGGNYSPYAKSEEIEEDRFSDFIFAYGANAGITLQFLRSNRSPLFFGLEADYQYDRYHSNTELDFFDQKRLFDLYTSSAGVNIGYHFDSGNDYELELLLKGGAIINSFVRQEVGSNNYQIITTSPFGYYGELQLNIVRYRGSGFFLATRLWFNKKIETNLDSIFAIEGLRFDIPQSNITLRLGARFGLF